jgi:hypothetical protein
VRIWLRAAEEFTQSPAPPIGPFAVITADADWRFFRSQYLKVAVHVVEEIVRARAKTNPDKVDATLLRSRSIDSFVRGHCDDLLIECAKAGIIAGDAERNARLHGIDGAIERRRRAMGLKGRGYFLD